MPVLMDKMACIGPKTADAGAWRSFFTFLQMYARRLPGHGTPAFRGLVHTGAHGLSSGSMVHFPEEGLKAGHGADTGFTAGVCAGGGFWLCPNRLTGYLRMASGGLPVLRVMPKSRYF